MALALEGVAYIYTRDLSMEGMEHAQNLELEAGLHRRVYPKRRARGLKLGPYPPHPNWLTFTSTIGGPCYLRQRGLPALPSHLPPQAI